VDNPNPTPTTPENAPTVPAAALTPPDSVDIPSDVADASNAPTTLGTAAPENIENLERLAAANPTAPNPVTPTPEPEPYRPPGGPFQKGNTIGFKPGNKPTNPVLIQNQPNKVNFESDNEHQRAVQRKNRRGRTTRQARFLKAYRKTPNVHLAAQAAGYQGGKPQAVAAQLS